MRTLLVAVICCAASAAVAYAQGAGRGAAAPGPYAVAVAADGRTAWRISINTGAVSVCIAGPSSAICQDWAR